MKRIIACLLISLSMFLFSCKTKDYLEVNKNIIMNIGDFTELEAYKYEKGEIVKTIDDMEIIYDEVSFLDVDGVYLYAKDSGDIDITIKCDDITEVIHVHVNPKPAKSLHIIGEKEMVAGRTQQLSATVGPDYVVDKTVTWWIESKDSNLAKIDQNGVLTALNEGKVTVHAYSNLTEDIKNTFEVIIYPANNVAPTIKLEEGTEVIEINFNNEFDYLDGVSATDDLMGDVSSNITYEGTVDVQTLGEYQITYYATDIQGNKSAGVVRTYKVIYDTYLKFIGHAGCLYGIMNTERAFINAGKAGYDCVECDLKQTKDGVFVLCHDDDFGNVNIPSSNYADIKDYEKTQSRGGSEYKSKLCTLERYFEICKEYNMIAIIELKDSKGIAQNDQSRMQALMNFIEAHDMLDQVIFLGSAYNCLIWVKTNGYEFIPCQYLVNSLESDTVYNRCVQYGFDVSFEVSDQTKNKADVIKKYHDAGCLVGCYTFSIYSTAKDLQEFINRGVDFVTVDKLTAKDVQIPRTRIN